MKNKIVFVEEKKKIFEFFTLGTTLPCISYLFHRTLTSSAGNCDKPRYLPLNTEPNALPGLLAT